VLPIAHIPRIFGAAVALVFVMLGAILAVRAWECDLAGTPVDKPEG
jgi:hypothetical protein